jgi:ribose-phosphate pyrophosphokinase
MILDLRQGFGDFPEYKLFKFPDNSIKFELKSSDPVTRVITTLRTNDDIIALAFVKDVIDHSQKGNPMLIITYMMYQQDDRRFKAEESFGLKIVSNFINSMNWEMVMIYHPHSDKVEFINKCIIRSNREFLEHSIAEIKASKGDDTPLTWVIPDSGAFKTQFKQIEKLNYPNFITCMKSRDHATGEIKTIVNTEDLQGNDCFIVDDICLGGRTFKNIAQELKAKNCGKLYLIVSHGIFNYGVEDLLEVFDTIYTTDSICTTEHERLKVRKLERI